MRRGSYGQDTKFTAADKFGIYLSQRMVLKQIRFLAKNDIALLDLGCGYNALFLRKLSPLTKIAYGVDLAVSQEIKALPKTKIIEGPIEQAVLRLEHNYFDVILLISVLEHLDDPFSVLKESYGLLKDRGILLVNVPTWRGKFFLETSAYVFKLSPKAEIDDHKMYYDKKDLWPLLIKAGFKPSTIRMRYHKFGLNLYAVCKKEEEIYSL